MVHPVRNILNRLRWDAEEDPEDYLITYRHRGAPGNMKQIRASRIKRLGKSYFTLQDEGQPEETLIPFHRILEIRNSRKDSTVWVKRMQ